MFEGLYCLALDMSVGLHNIKAAGALVAQLRVIVAAQSYLLYSSLCSIHYCIFYVLLFCRRKNCTVHKVVPTDPALGVNAAQIAKVCNLSLIRLALQISLLTVFQLQCYNPSLCIVP